MELVVFLSCFHSFREEARYHQAVLSLMWKKLWCCRDLLALGLENVEIVQGVPDALVFTIQTRKTAELVTVTVVPAYRALGKGRGSRSDSHTCPPRETRVPSPPVHDHMQTPAFIHSTHVLSWGRSDHRAQDWPNVGHCVTQLGKRLPNNHVDKYVIARGDETHRGECVRSIIWGASVAFITGVVFVLFQKQTLRQGFEDKQSQEMLIGKYGRGTGEERSIVRSPL